MGTNGHQRWVTLDPTHGFQVVLTQDWIVPTLSRCLGQPQRTFDGIEDCFVESSILSFLGEFCWLVKISRGEVAWLMVVWIAMLPCSKIGTDYLAKHWIVQKSTIHPIKH